MELENSSFRGDRLSGRSYRSLLVSTTASVIVAESQGTLAGSLVLLFNRSKSVARLYSLAVARPFRGRGVARLLLLAAKQASLARDCGLLQLEVRVDNVAARSLYASEGFEFVKHIPAYYQDGTDAVRVQRLLRQKEP